MSLAVLGRKRSVGFLTGVDRFATNEALDEIYRVLKEGTVFGMIWNIDDCEIGLDLVHEITLILLICGTDIS